MFDYEKYTSISSDLLVAAENTVVPITFFITGQQTTNVPDIYFNYSNGMIFRRTSAQIFILIFSRDGRIAVNSLNEGSWSGWNIK